MSLAAVTRPFSPPLAIALIRSSANDPTATASFRRSASADENLLAKDPTPYPVRAPLNPPSNNPFKPPCLAPSSAPPALPKPAATSGLTSRLEASIPPRIASPAPTPSPAPSKPWSIPLVSTLGIILFMGRAIGIPNLSIIKKLSGDVAALNPPLRAWDAPRRAAPPVA